VSFVIEKWDIMIVDNLDKIVGLVGVIAGIEIIVIAIFTVSVLYLRNPVTAGVIGNISNLTMIMESLATG